MYDSTDLLIVAALPQEVDALQDSYPCVITGCGKVNATLYLIEHLTKLPQKPKLVLNLGSAGSPTLPHDTLAEVSLFLQHDMDCSALGFAKGTTPFDLNDALSGAISGYPRFNLVQGVCATGDHFVSQRLDMNYDLVDMEAYALAKACRHLEIPFSSIKFVTDGADGTASTDWRENVHRAAESFRRVLAERIDAVLASINGENEPTPLYRGK